MNELEQIHKRVRMGVLEALEESESGALARPALFKRVTDVAADEDDLDLALQQLQRSGIVERVPGAGPIRWRQAGNAKASDRQAANSEADSGDRSSVEQAAHESAHAARHKSPAHNGLLDRCVGAIREADKSLSPIEIADVLGEENRRRVTHNLGRAASEKRRVVVTERVGRTPYYGLIEWADEHPIAEPSYHAADRPANDAPATTGHRFGLWSDGTLAIETGAGELNLPPAVTHDLIAYLIRERTQVAHLFDTELEV